MLINDKIIIEQIDKLNKETFSLRNKLVQLETRIEVYNSENYRMSTIIRALLNYLKVDIHKELVADTRVMPAEQAMTEIVVLKKYK
jgi:dynactin complex subunit